MYHTKQLSVRGSSIGAKILERSSRFKDFGSLERRIRTQVRFKATKTSTAGLEPQTH